MPSSHFIVELPLRDPALGVERMMLKRLAIATFAYDQCEEELRRRDRLMRESVEYRRLSAEYRASKNGRCSSNPAKVTFQTREECAEAWKVLQKRFHLYGTDCLNAYAQKVHADLKLRTVSGSLPFTLIHELAVCAWRAYGVFRRGERAGAQRRRFLRRRPHRQPFAIISSRSSEKNHGPLKFTATGISWSNGRRGQGKALVTLPAIIDNQDAVVQHALATDAAGCMRQAICQVRIGYRTVRGKHRWFTQLVLEGEAYKKLREPCGDGSVGVDMGSQHAAVVAVSAGYAKNHLLNPDVAEALRKGQAAERRRARAQARSKRAMNPDAFDEKGRNIRGKRAAKRSKRYRLLSAERQEAQRVLNESKRQQRNALANRVISLGTSVRMEKLTHRTWQRAGMGRSMLASTPGALTTAIKRACKKYEREFIEIDPWRAKLSQFCHACGRYTKKPISGPIASRMSTCDCGRVPVQRDLYSAYLALFCDANGNVDRDRAREKFSDFLASLGDVRETPDAYRAERDGRG